MVFHSVDLLYMSNRGTISLVFDDGYEVIYRHVVPLLNELKIPATFAVPLDPEAVVRTEDRPCVPWEAWQELEKSGHELAAHGVTHQSFKVLDPVTLDEELRLPAQTLRASTLVYPGGGYNPDVKKAAATYYQAARTTEPGFESLPPQDPMALKTINYTRNNFSVLKANARALWAYATNRWLIETYHLVDDAERSRVHSVGLTEFTKHLRFIARIPLRKVTIRQALHPL